ELDSPFRVPLQALDIVVVAASRLYVDPYIKEGLLQSTSVCTRPCSRQLCAHRDELCPRCVSLLGVAQDCTAEPVLCLYLRSAPRIHRQLLHAEQREKLVDCIVRWWFSQQALPGSLNMIDYNRKYSALLTVSCCIL